MKSKANLGYIGIFFLISIVLNVILFSKLGEGDILFVHDQFVKFNYFETFINSFFIKKFRNLGVHNSWEFITAFWDYLFYLIVYKLGLSIIAVERLFFLLTDFSLLTISFFGFKKMKNIFEVEVSDLLLFSITLWYGFNPYILTVKHAGVYTIGWMLTYSLAPYILYYFHKGVLNRKVSIKYVILCAIFIYIASFTFWLFAVFAFFLAIYFFLYLIINRKSVFYFLINIEILLLLTLPLVLPVVFSTVFEFLSPSGAAKVAVAPTFGLQEGGMWYQMLLISSWAIYREWTPRTLYPFSDFFFSIPYIFSVLTLYLIILLGFLPVGKILREGKELSKRTTKFGIILLIVLFISIFFAKGSQPPLGGIFTALYNGFPLFRVFRSADFRFGFSTVLSISLLLVIFSQRFNKYAISLVLIVITIFQGYRILDGSVYIGENIKDKYFDRKVKIPDDYSEIADLIDSKKSFGYVLPVHSIHFGQYLLEGGESHLGQDILSKIIKAPFIYITLLQEMPVELAEKFIVSIGSKDLSSIDTLPIKYILLRKDIVCPKCIEYKESDIPDKFDLVLKKDMISVYEVESYKPVLDSDNIEFEIVNPVRYKIRLKNVTKPQELDFMMSFDKNWKLYIEESYGEDFCGAGQIVEYSGVRECTGKYKLLEGDELSFLTKKPVFEGTHMKGEGYANSWTVGPQENGSSDLDLVLYYKPQSVFYLTFIVSGLALIAQVGFLIWKRRN